MQVVKDACVVNGAPVDREYPLDILSQANTGAWVLNLPPRLRDYQSELEALLGRVFAGKQSRDNFELAQQMTINWCVSKYRKIGIAPDEALH